MTRLTSGVAPGAPGPGTATSARWQSPGAPVPPVPLVELRDVRAGYGPLEALHGVSLVLPVGALVALTGSNGAGRSTVLKVLAGQVPVRGGEVFWRGRALGPVGDPGHRARRGVTLIPEGRGIFPGLTVRDNLQLFVDAAAGAQPDRPATRDTGPDRSVTAADRMAAALAVFPRLAARAGQVAGSLSGGEQQMLALTRALITDPVLLLIDELSLGLAPLVTAELYEVVAGLRAPERTIVVVEQFIDHALRHADVAYRLSRGRVAFGGDPDELRALLRRSAAGATDRA